MKMKTASICFSAIVLASLAGTTAFADDGNQNSTPAPTTQTASQTTMINNLILKGPVQNSFQNENREKHGKKPHHGGDKNPTTPTTTTSAPIGT